MVKKEKISMQMKLARAGKANKALEREVEEKNELIQQLQEEIESEKHNLEMSTVFVKANDAKVEALEKKVKELEVRVQQTKSTIDWYASGAKEDRSRAIKLWETVKDMNESIGRLDHTLKHLFTSFISLYVKNVDLEEIEEVSLYCDLDPRGTVPLTEVLRLFKYIYKSVIPRERPMMRNDWINQPIDMKGEVGGGIYRDEDAGDWLDGEPKT